MTHDHNRPLSLVLLFPPRPLLQRGRKILPTLATRFLQGRVALALSCRYSLPMRQGSFAAGESIREQTVKKGSKHSAETLRLLSEKSRQAWVDPELRARAAQRTAETYRDGTRPRSDVWTPEMRARQSERMKEIYDQRPGLRAQIAASMANAYRDGRAGRRPASWSPEARARQSERMKKIYADRPELRVRIAESVAKAHREGRMPAPAGGAWTPEERRRASQRMRGNIRPQKTRAQMARERELKVAGRARERLDKHLP
jgi:hypothetical protein